MKIIAHLTQVVEFPEPVDLNKIKTVDDWDELLVTRAAAIDTSITKLEQQQSMCPKCQEPLREINMNGLDKPVLFCKNCKNAYEEEPQK